MRIQLNCLGQAQETDLAAVVPALAAAVASADVDHSRVAAVLDWVQHRRNFRAPVMARPFAHATERHDGSTTRPLAEIAIDVRRAKDIPFADLRQDILDRLSKALGLMPDVHECIHLEDWVRPSKSVIWAFNRAYWRHLRAWDDTFDRDYAAALPGGVSDGTNAAFWHDQIASFMQTLARLEEWSELPEQIHVLEFGVGDGNQAEVWLEQFAEACDATGRPYFERLRYLIADYSPHVLQRAMARLSRFDGIVDALELDFRNPIHGLAHLRGRVLFAHAANLYDNLPTDELMRVGDRAYEPLVRASITPREIAELSTTHAVPEKQLVPTIQRVLREGPQAIGRAQDGVRFWSDAWEAVHLEEMYTEIPAPGCMRVTPSVELHLDELLHELPEWTRVHASTVPIESYAQTLALLHHQGTLIVQDLFATDISEYATFRGPGKLEGSIVNWLNGPAFRLVGRRAGFDIEIAPFTYRAGSNITVLQARPRDAFAQRNGAAADTVATVSKPS